MKVEFETAMIRTPQREMGLGDRQVARPHPQNDCVTVLEPAPLTAEIEQELCNDEVERIRCLVPAAEIVLLREADFVDKKRWFYDKCSKLEADRRNSGRVSIKARKNALLADAIDTVLSLNRNELRKVWSYSFEGESARSDVNASEKWFALLFNELCCPRKGLFQSSSNRRGLQINPWSGMYNQVGAMCRVHPWNYHREAQTSQKVALSLCSPPTRFCSCSPSVAYYGPKRDRISK